MQQGSRPLEVVHRYVELRRWTAIAGKRPVKFRFLEAASRHRVLPTHKSLPATDALAGGCLGLSGHSNIEAAAGSSAITAVGPDLISLLPDGQHSVGANTICAEIEQNGHLADKQYNQRRH